MTQDELIKLKAEILAKKGKYGLQRFERALDEIPNLHQMFSYEALREAFLGDNAKALMTMNPASFQDYAVNLPQWHLDLPDTKEHLKNLAEIKGFSDVPYLTIDKKEQGLPIIPHLTGHEGRHRSMALAKKGVKGSLVMLNPRAELREPFPRREQGEYIDALRNELAMTGNMVTPEKGWDAKNLQEFSRPPVKLPDVYGKGGSVHGHAVDANGNPLDLYHGTTRDFDKFELGHPERKDVGWLGHGLYFTNSREMAQANAQMKAKRVGGTPKVMSVNLSLQNPYYATLEDKARLQKANSSEASKAFTEALKGKGHDGVIWKSGDYHEYVAFDPDQVTIKKAEGGEVLPVGHPQREANLGKFMEGAHPAVLNKDGTPKLFYHATYASEPIKAFDRLWSTKVRKPSMDTVGTWFSDTPSEEGGAGMYAQGQGASIYPMHLSAKKLKTYHRFDDFLRDMHEAEGRKLEEQNPKGQGSAEGLREKLKAQGYDGLYFPKNESVDLFTQIENLKSTINQAKSAYSSEAKRRWDEGEDMSLKEMKAHQKRIDNLVKQRMDLEKKASSYGGTEFGGQNVVVVFEPTQIKSPWNQGTFDPNDSDTHKAEGGEVDSDLKTAKRLGMDTSSIPEIRKAGQLREAYKTLGEKIREGSMAAAQRAKEYHESGKLPLPVGTRFTTEHSRKNKLPPFKVLGHYVDHKDPERYGYRTEQGEEGRGDYTRGIQLVSDPKADTQLEKLGKPFDRKAYWDSVQVLGGITRVKAEGGVIRKGGPVSLDAMRLALLNRPKMAEGGQPQRKVSPLGFYSPAAEAAANLPQDVGTPEQMAAMLAKNRGVTDEMQHSGYAQRVTAPKVSKQDLIQHFESEMPDVQETVLGSGNALTKKWSINSPAHEDHYDVVAPDGTIKFTGSQNEADRYIQDNDTATRYDDRVIPGGTNYREVLLTLPAKAKVAPSSLTTSDGRTILLSNETRRRINKDQGLYHSSHWDQPNVLVHFRVNDRTDKDGKKVLFVEEIQSDWGQQGREKGFLPSTTTPPSGYSIELRDLSRTVPLVPSGTMRWGANYFDDILGENRLIGPYDTREQAVEGAWTHNNKGKTFIPAAPFVSGQKKTVVVPVREEQEYADKFGNLKKRKVEVAYNVMYDDSHVGQYKSRQEAEAAAAKLSAKNEIGANTEGWLNLALKRIAKMAVDGGYDKVAFVNGDQSANRYDLSKQVGSVHYFPEGDGVGKGTLVAMPIGSDIDSASNAAMTHDNVAPEDLEKYVGKDLAKSLLETPKVNGRHTIAGEGLKVGGEGMRKFYDQIVPAALNKLLPRIKGKRLETVHLVNQAQDEAEGTMLHQPGFEITPEMREHVKKGLPIFKRGGSAQAPLSLPQMKVTMMKNSAQGSLLNKGL